MKNINFSINFHIFRYTKDFFLAVSKQYPSLCFGNDIDYLIVGMSYILTSTLDRSIKGLYNRSKIVLKKVNLSKINDDFEILSIEIETEDKLICEIGPIWDVKNCILKFPIKLAFVENTYQIQGETFQTNVYVDFNTCVSYIDRFVTITRVKNSDQLKILYKSCNL